MILKKVTCKKKKKFKIKSRVFVLGLIFDVHWIEIVHSNWILFFIYAKNFSFLLNSISQMKQTRKSVAFWIYFLSKFFFFFLDCLSLWHLLKRHWGQLNRCGFHSMASQSRRQSRHFHWYHFRHWYSINLVWWVLKKKKICRFFLFLFVCFITFTI